jgi:hypothetical protein
VSLGSLSTEVHVCPQLHVTSSSTWERKGLAVGRRMCGSDGRGRYGQELGPSYWSVHVVSCPPYNRHEPSCVEHCTKDTKCDCVLPQTDTLYSQGPCRHVRYCVAYHCQYHEIHRNKSFWQTVVRSAAEDIPCLLRNLKVCTQKPANKQTLSGPEK